MVIICSKCEGSLELAPKGTSDARICSARCGHVFHIHCWSQYCQEFLRLRTSPKEFRVLCPSCGVKCHPAIFEMFPSTQDGKDSEEILALRQRYEAISRQRDTARAELQEKEDHFDKNAVDLREMESYSDSLIRERDEAEREFHDRLMETETSNNQKLSENGGESKNESVEINSNEVCCTCTTIIQEFSPEFNRLLRRDVKPFDHAPKIVIFNKKLQSKEIGKFRRC